LSCTISNAHGAILWLLLLPLLPEINAAIEVRTLLGSRSGIWELLAAHGGALGLEAEAGKEQVNLSFELGPVVAQQCRANQSLQAGGDDLGYALGVEFGRQFTGVFGGSQAVRQRADKGGNIRLNELLQVSLG
jgi:hypothetical protein